MAVKIDCPRCKKTLSIPQKKTGGYVSCPNCSGRFWVPKEGDGGPGPGLAVPSMTAVPQSAPPAPPVQAPPPVQAASPGAPPAVHPPPVQVPTAGKKVARFISPETTQSTLKVAEDGKLPELHLQEGATKKKKGDAQSTTVNPLVLFGALALSAVFSVILVLYEPGSDSASGIRGKNQARRDIANLCLPGPEKFDDRDNRPELEKYQEYVREAQRAYRRGDLKAERRYYRKVLDLLRAEQGTIDDAPGDRFRSKRLVGVTGSPADDRELEQLIAIVLRGG